jgi:hypothetical protein
VAWNNEEVFPTFKPRKSTGIPDQILLEVFPPGESHQKHMMFINHIRAGVYGVDSFPKFWKVLQPEKGMAREER